MSMDRDPNVYDRETRVYDRDRGGSNFMAFLIGGLVIAVGLLAFLFYRGGNDEVGTTSSVTPGIERPATPSTPSATPATPERPATPAAPATGAPAGSTAPATPSNPQ